MTTIDATLRGAVAGAGDDLTLTLQAAAEGQHRVLIDRVLPLSEAVQAHRIVADRSGTGKVVLQPA